MIDVIVEIESFKVIIIEIQFEKDQCLVEERDIVIKVKRDVRNEVVLVGVILERI